MNQALTHFIAICSDSIGETAEAVVQATLRQFELPNTEIKRYMNVRDEDELTELMEEVARRGGFVAYTPTGASRGHTGGSRTAQHSYSGYYGADDAGLCRYVQRLSQTVAGAHRLDDSYFRRVDAMEFAVQYDDGKDVSAILKADIILLGVSRISKTPLSMFLAHKGYKTVNFPIVPEMSPPSRLREVTNGTIIGLTIEPEHLLKIRDERLKVMGLPHQVQYATLERIQEELDYALSLYAELGCPVIDVTDKAIEESAGLIMNYLK